MDVDTISQDSILRGRGKNKRFWTPIEDDELIKSLRDLSADPKWKGEGGFKSGYMNQLEEKICSKFSNSDLRADPHIESQLKHWSEKYTAMAEMLGTSRFGWNDEKKMLAVEKTVYDAWVKTHKKARGLYGVPFPYYETLAEIYSKDLATGTASESFANAINSMDAETRVDTVTLESDDDDDASSINQTSCLKRNIKNEDVTQPPLKKAKKLKSKRKEYKVTDDSMDLATSLQSVSNTFGKIFENMNENLGAMANAWSKAEEREQRLNEKNDKVLDEVLKLEGISPTEALEVVTILMAEEHKFRVFYQASSAMRKQYILDLLRK